MNVYEFKSVKIDGNTYDIDVYELQYTMVITDYEDDYGYGESAKVITDIDFDCVIIHLYGSQIDINHEHESWESIKKQVKWHIFDDEEFMQEWQDREFAE